MPNLFSFLDGIINLVLMAFMAYIVILAIFKVLLDKLFISRKTVGMNKW